MSIMGVRSAVVSLATCRAKVHLDTTETGVRAVVAKLDDMGYPSRLAPDGGDKESITDARRSVVKPTASS